MAKTMKSSTAAPRKQSVQPAGQASRRTVHKRQTHERILKSAGRVARREGLAAASVPRVMHGAGLTIGGFYSHFASKQAMDAEIVRTLLGELPGRWLGGLEAASGTDWIARAVDRYLSAAHRDDLTGCAYPAVVSELARAAPAVRRAFADVFEQRVAAFVEHVPATTGVTRRERALATLAVTIGGLVLARAAKGDPVSDEILEACRKWAVPERSQRSRARTRPAIRSGSSG
jgi:TetR/AcrR family transcriptional repressor of nem operon